MTRATHRRTTRRGRARRVVATFAASCALTVAVAVLVAGAVQAVMTLGGGAGTATSASTVTVTLSPGTGGADLLPGGRGTVRLVATNPEPAAVAVGRLALDTARGTGGFATGNPGCPASVFSLTAQDNGGRGWTVPARSGGVDGSLAIDLPSAVSMSGTAPDACQGVRVTVHLVARA